VVPASAAPRTRPRLLVCCGDLTHPRKNVALAVEALGILGARGVTAELELVGGNAEALAPQLSRLPAAIAVTCPGRVAGGEVHSRMATADALLFPSRYEEWGYVAVEAALHGTPAVTLPVYPFAEMLPAPLGVRAAGMTPAHYADAISALLASPPARDEIASIAEARFGLVNTGRALAAVWSQPAGAEAGTRRVQPPS
jgi:glycosyltransferase involved in cell wall biosynthesis